MSQIGLDEFLSHLRAARDTTPKRFAKRLLDFAIAKVEQEIRNDAKRVKGSLPRIPAANAQIIKAAIAERDLERILGIRDARGSHGSENTRIEAFLKEYCAKYPDASARQISKEAKRLGIRADRCRIAGLLKQLNLGRDNVAARKQRVKVLDQIDVVFVHLQAEVMVLGFAIQGCDEFLERISDTEKDEAPAPLIAPTSADRARLVDFSRALVERQAALPDQTADWRLLLDDIEKEKGNLAMIHVGSVREVPAHVLNRLRTVAPVVTQCKRDWLLKELIRPELYFLGAGFLPTLANTLERLELVPGGQLAVCIWQSDATRTDALWLRLRLQEEFASYGIIIKVGERQALRLAQRTRLVDGGSAYTGAALLVPSPIDLSIFQLAEEPYTENLQLDFSGVDHLFAESHVDDLVELFNHAIRIQNSFAAGRQTERMRKCAEFFRIPEGRLSSIRDMMGRRPDFRKMTRSSRLIWAAYVLTLFDPDVIHPFVDFGGHRDSPFPTALQNFLRSGADWIESWRSRSLTKYMEGNKAPFLVEEAIEATSFVMGLKLSRVWKFGIDEASKRVATAIERISQKRIYGTEWRKNPGETIDLLAGYFQEVWPTVCVTRKTFESRAGFVFHSTLRDSYKRQGKLIQIVPGDEFEAGCLSESVLVGTSSDSSAGERIDTPAMLICERLKAPIAKGDERRLAAWYAQFLASVRRAVEDDARTPFLPPDVLPTHHAALLREAVEHSMNGGNLGKVGKQLSEALEKFFNQSAARSR